MFNVAIFKLKRHNQISCSNNNNNIYCNNNYKIFFNKKETQITIPTPQIYKKSINSQIPAIEGEKKRTKQ